MSCTMCRLSMSSGTSMTLQDQPRTTSPKKLSVLVASSITQYACTRRIRLSITSDQSFSVTHCCLMRVFWSRWLERSIWSPRPSQIQRR